MAKQLVAVAGDVFAGFFTLGVRQAGFEVPLHLAHIDYAIKTYRLNFPTSEVRIGKDKWASSGFPPSVDLMFTNPPCASWSGAGMSRKEGACNDLKEKWKCDPRSQWPMDLTHVAIQMRTRAFVWESVTNAWKYGRSFVDELAHLWLSEGYSVTVQLQNNCYLGAPQNRKRMFFIAHKHPLVWPELTMQSPPASMYLELAKREKAVPGPKWKNPGWDRMWEMSTKELNYANFNGIYHKKLGLIEKAAVKSIPGMSVKVVAPDKLPGVLNERMVHPFEARFLSIRELQLLSGIPYDWKFSGGYNSSALEMARTVLPAAGKFVATAVKDGLGKKVIVKPAYKLVDMEDGSIKEMSL